MALLYLPIAINLLNLCQLYFSCFCCNFQAFHKHKVVDPLENPGASDLTADVDFQQLRIAASKAPSDDNFALVVGPVQQKDFLERSQARVRLQVILFSDTGFFTRLCCRTAWDSVYHRHSVTRKLASISSLLVIFSQEKVTYVLFKVPRFVHTSNHQNRFSGLVV